jgi:hypothetical protein
MLKKKRKGGKHFKKKRKGGIQNTFFEPHFKKEEERWQTFLFLLPL